MADKAGEGGAGGTTASIGFIGSVTLPGDAVPHPAAGSRRMGEWMARHFRGLGCVLRVDAVTMVTLARPNTADGSGLRPMLREALDGEGRPMPDRRISIIEHAGVTHPWELLMIEGETGRASSYAYMATAEAAAAVGQSWQEGRLRVDLGALPRGTDPTRARGA